MIPMFHGQNRSSYRCPNVNYGYLYNDCCLDSSFAPTGWSIGSSAQWDTLVSYLGTNAAGKLKETGTTHWLTPNVGAVDDFNFSAVGGGFRNATNDAAAAGFYNKDLFAYYYNEESGGPFGIMFRRMYYNSGDFLSKEYHYYKDGASVRLVYSGIGAPSENFVVDADRNKYNIIQIGTQYWLDRNWVCTKMNDGTTIPNISSDPNWYSAGWAMCSYDNDPNNAIYI